MKDKDNVGGRQALKETVGRQSDSQISMAVAELKRDGLPSHFLYEYASEIFNYLTKRSSERASERSPSPPIAEELLACVAAKRMVYDLAFGAWRHREVLSEILEDGEFFFRYFHLREKMSLVLVMLFDYQRKRFSTKTFQQCDSHAAHSSASSAIEEIADALLSKKTKLSATLAKARVKSNSPDIVSLLSEERKKMVVCSQLMPLCARINTLKTDSESVVTELRKNCWTLQRDQQEAPVGASTFTLDPVCPHTLLFSVEAKGDVYGCPLVKEGKLVVEDKVDVMITESIGRLISHGAKVIVTCVGNGNIVCSLAAMMNNTGTIYAFEALPNEKPKLQDKMKQLGVTNVFLLTQYFTGVDVQDVRFQDVTAVVIVPPCSNSTVINPVDYVMLHGDEELASLPEGLDDEATLGEIPSLSIGQKELLEHALLFSQVQTVVYCTRSKHYAENDAVVEATMDMCRQYRAERNSLLPDKNDHVKHFQLYTPDLVYTLKPSTGKHQTKLFSNENTLKVPPLDLRRLSPSSSLPDSYLRVEPSSASDGCFLAILQRIPKSARASTPVCEVLRRAAAKGLLSDIDYLNGQDEEAEIKGKKKVKGRIKRRPSTSLTQLTEAAKNRMAATKSKLPRQNERKLHDKPFRM